MKFEYQAKNKDGEIKIGIIDASDKETAFNILKAKDFYVTSLQKYDIPIYQRKLKLFKGIRKKEIVIFSRQLSIMFQSRVPLIETLQTLSKQTRNEELRDVIEKIGEDVKGGNSLSSSFTKYPHLFSTFYINMVKAGEASGKLNEIFLYLADYLERQQRLKGKVRGALIYPIFVIIVFIAVVILMLVYIIPQITLIIDEIDEELPLITRMIIGISDFLIARGWLIIVAVILLVVAFWRIIKNPQGKIFFDNFILKIPILNILLRKIYLTQIALSLSTLTTGGLLLTQSLEITEKIVNNSVYKNIIKKTQEQVKKGESMSFILGQYPTEISPIFLQMIVVGEKTGSMGSSLQNIVNFYQEEVDNNIDGAIKLIEPILIILLAVVVGGLVAAVLLPIFTISLGQI